MSWTGSFGSCITHTFFFFPRRRRRRCRRPGRVCYRIRCRVYVTAIAHVTCSSSCRNVYVHFVGGGGFVWFAWFIGLMPACFSCWLLFYCFPFRPHNNTVLSSFPFGCMYVAGMYVRRSGLRTENGDPRKQEEEKTIFSGNVLFFLFLIIVLIIILPILCAIIPAHGWSILLLQHSRFIRQPPYCVTVDLPRHTKRSTAAQSGSTAAALGASMANGEWVGGVGR